MKRLAPLVAALLAVAALARGEEKPPAAPLPCAEKAALGAFRAGEVFAFKVRWGPFDEAAHLTIATSLEQNLSPHFRILTTMSSRGFVRRFHAVDNRVDTVLDLRPWRVRMTSVSTSEGKKRSHVTTTLHYARGEAVVTDHVHPEKNAVLPLPHPCMLDAVSGILMARAFDLEPGEERHLLLHDEGKEYLLTIEAQAVETLQTPLGELEALRVRPRMDVNPKGFFRRQGELTVWYSRDERRLPLRIQTKLKVGSAVATLDAYTPPADAPEATAAAR